MAHDQQTAVNEAVLFSPPNFLQGIRLDLSWSFSLVRENKYSNNQHPLVLWYKTRAKYCIQFYIHYFSSQVIPIKCHCYPRWARGKLGSRQGRLAQGHTMGLSTLPVQSLPWSVTLRFNSSFVTITGVVYQKKGMMFMSFVYSKV